MATAEQDFCRGRLESEESTPAGYVGWRWLQCTDIPDEYRVLIPPTVARCYTQLKEAEESELQAQCHPTDWKQIAALRHVKDRLIKRCCQIEKFRPGYEAFMKHSVVAPPNFTLRQLERWARDQNAQGFARPLKHRSSTNSKTQTASSASVGTPSMRTSVTNSQSPSTPLRLVRCRNVATPTQSHSPPTSLRTINSRITPKQSPPAPLQSVNTPATPSQSPSATLRPANAPSTPTPSPTHRTSPATSLSGCVYVVFRCPRHCPIECCEKDTQTFAPPNASHPVVDMLPPEVVPTQSQQRYGCQCSSPYEEQQGRLEPIMNTPADIRQESLQSRFVNESDDREPALNSSPPAPIALQLLTPEASAPVNQKPLPPTPPRDSLNLRQQKKKVFATEEQQTSTPVDEKEPLQRHLPASSTFKTSRKQPSAADKKFQEQNPSLFSLPSSFSGQPISNDGLQQLDLTPPSTCNKPQEPPAVTERKGKEKPKPKLVVMNQSPKDLDPFSPPTIREERPTVVSEKTIKGKEKAVIPGETQIPNGSFPNTGGIGVDGGDFPSHTTILPRKSTVTRTATHPEMPQRKKSVHFTSQTPSLKQQLPPRLARKSGPLIPQIMITLPSPSVSSEESLNEMYNEQLLVPLATMNTMNN